MAMLALLSTILAVASASISNQVIPGTYTFAYGAKSCAPQVRTDRKVRLMPVGYKCAVEPLNFLDFDKSEGDQLSYYLAGRKEAKKRSVKEPNFGRFYIGVAQQDYNCTNPKSLYTFAYKKGTVANFFTPEKLLQVNLTAVFTEGNSNLDETHSEKDANSATHKLVTIVRSGGSSAAETGSKVPASDSPKNGALLKVKPFQLDPRLRYLSVGSQCLYTRTSPPTCFPADATVIRADGARIRMDQLRVGDSVAVGAGSFSPVFMWTHYDASTVSVFIRARTADSRTLVVSPGHFVYANGVLMDAKDLNVGDRLRGADGFDDAEIVSVDTVIAKGLYNPQTTHGDIVVDGFVTSTYTTFVPPQAAHALLTPLRSVVSLVRASMRSAATHTEL